MAVNNSLESIIKGRSTQRKFSNTEIPSNEDLEKIIEAGIYAPFPALGTDRMTSPRQFIILQNGTREWDELLSIIVNKSKNLYKIAKRKNLYRMINYLTPKAHRIDDRIIAQSKIYGRMIAELRGDFAHFKTAPYWIIIAERRHMPFVMTKLARQSMGHCLQNMWLMATDMGIGMQPMSTIYQVQNAKKVCKLLGLQGQNWEMDSVLVGYPVEKLKPTDRNFNLDQDIIWHNSTVE